MPIKGMGKAAVDFVRQLEDVGKTVSRYGRATRVAGFQSGSSMQRMAGTTIRNTGRAMGAMGRNPKTTMVGGALMGSYAIGGPRGGNMRGPSLADQMRQNTGYNTKMRSSGANGLSPRSMGGYA
jgi:hypothetical protein